MSESASTDFSSFRQSSAASVAIFVMPASPAEDHPPLEHRRRIVEVDDRLLHALEALVRALDQLRAALGQHLDRTSSDRSSSINCRMKS